MELNCFTVLCSAIQQCESAISIHMFAPSLNLPPHPNHMPTVYVVTEYHNELPVLYSNSPLAISFTYCNAYVSTLLSTFILPSPSPAIVHQYHFLDSIYVLIYDISYSAPSHCIIFFNNFTSLILSFRCSLWLSLSQKYLFKSYTGVFNCFQL